MDVSTPDPNKPKAPTTHDPGWNDPPLFSYNATKAATQPGKRGPLLNKRVAFPMGPGSAGSVPTAATQLSCGAGDHPPMQPPLASPPVPPSGASPVAASLGDAPPTAAPPPGGLPGASPLGAPPPAQTKTAVPGPAPCGSREAVEKGVDVLCQLVESLPADDKREKEDIQKRLIVLRKMCEEEKLNRDIYGRLVQLATSLQSGDTATASHIQRGLMVDHVGLCSSWMAGVRLLVRRLADSDS